MTISIGSGSIVTGSSSELIALDGGYLELIPQGFNFSTFQIIPASLRGLNVDGSERFAPVAYAGEGIWHFRDDGGGAFTTFNVERIEGVAIGRKISYDASGTVIEDGTYDFPQRQIDVFGAPVTQAISETLTGTTDLGDGRIAGVFVEAPPPPAPGADPDPVIFSLVIYKEDGAVERRVEYEGTSAFNLGAASLPTVLSARSGDKIVVVHRYNDPFTSPTPEEDFQIYATVFDVNGNQLVQEFEVTEGDHVQGGFGFFANPLAVETLHDGNVVVAWRSQKVGTVDQTDVDVWMKIIAPDGSTVSSEKLVNFDNVLGAQHAIRIHPFDDGTFAITFDSDFTDSSSQGIFNDGVIQQFEADGTPIGSNQIPLARFQKFDKSVFQEDGTGFVATFGGGPQATFTLGDTVADLNDLPLPVGTGPSALNDSFAGTNTGQRTRLQEGDDIFAALRGDDTVAGGDGDDVIEGGFGDDILRGGLGNDALFGGAGNDDLIGNAGSDTLEGGAGADLLKGGAGFDLLRGGAARDQLIGGSGGDSMDGGGGRDWMAGQAGNDSMDGGAGNDRMFGASGTDDMRGGTGNDRLVGGADGDALRGEDGNDRLIGESGNDTIIGGDGDDRLVGGEGVDSLEGGTGIDTFVFDNAGGPDSDLISDYTVNEDIIEIALNGADASTVVVSTGSASTTVTYGTNQGITLTGVFDASDITFDFI